MLHKTAKPLFFSTITPRPFGDHSAVCRWSAYGLFSTNLTPPEKIYSSTQKEYTFLHERYTLF